MKPGERVQPRNRLARTKRPACPKCFDRHYETSKCLNVRDPWPPLRIEDFACARVDLEGAPWEDQTDE